MILHTKVRFNDIKLAAENYPPSKIVEFQAEIGCNLVLAWVITKVLRLSVKIDYRDKTAQ